MRISYFFYAVVALLFGVYAVAAISHSSFFSNRDGLMSPKTAVRLGLLSENEAPLLRALVFKRNDQGGFDYRDGGALSFLAPTHTTEMDVSAECLRVGGCELRVRPR